MAIANDSLSTNAMGGTELMKYGLAQRLPAELLNEFQIFVSRVEEPLDDTKIRVYWMHDLPGDPAADHLKNGGWKKFHRIVFCTNWQMQAFINAYGIPWSHCVVMQNAIDPIATHEKPNDKIRLGYWSTPHRGLNILIPVFEKLSEEYDNIELDVYSSFKLYGWEERDEQFRQLFDACENHPKINYYGALPNDQLRKGLENIHIMAYPSIWTETSCITLMEAMSAKILPVHSNLGALPETAANWSIMYQYHDDLSEHANIFYQVLKMAIDNYHGESIQSRLESMSSYANVFYNWNVRAAQWQAFLESIIGLPRDIPQDEGPVFVYRA